MNISCNEAENCVLKMCYIEKKDTDSMLHNSVLLYFIFSTLYS